MRVPVDLAELLRFVAPSQVDPLRHQAVRIFSGWEEVIGPRNEGVLPINTVSTALVSEPRTR
jgi:hypothetical protein